MTIILFSGLDSPFFYPFRKPKRIRTAFSPSQLIKLEQIFEKNHYVVGQERKDLALSLNLTETQVRATAKEITFTLYVLSFSKIKGSIIQYNTA